MVSRSDQQNVITIMKQRLRTIDVMRFRLRQITALTLVEAFERPGTYFRLRPKMHKISYQACSTYVTKVELDWRLPAATEGQVLDRLGA